MKKVETEIEIFSISKPEPFSRIVVEADSKLNFWRPSITFHVPYNEVKTIHVGQKLRVTIEVVEESLDMPDYIIGTHYIYAEGVSSDEMGIHVGEICPLELDNFEHFECDGQALSKADYPALYEVLRGMSENGEVDPYGEDKDTFNIPDLRAHIVTTKEDAASE